jgi:monoterpene epsilon-lactone hydrolase
VHRKLRQAGVAAQLEVYEGQSHGQFLIDPEMPETRELFADIKQFLANHLPASSRQTGAR